MKGGTEQPTRGQRNAKGQRDGETHNGEDGETQYFLDTQKHEQSFI